MVGTGYVGLVTGTCLADFGNQVICVDNDAKKIQLLKEGTIPFYEPGLEEMVRINSSKGRLEFSLDISYGVRRSEVIYLAVGTPSLPNGGVDLKTFLQAVEEIVPWIEDYKVIVDKSTVPIGTARRVKRILQGKVREGTEFDVVSNPEFLREGSAIGDFMRPNRVIIGTESERALEIMSEIYRPLYLLETPIVKTNWETAELIKYASNAFLATKISFINEMAILCERVGADVQVVARGMGLDGRIGTKFLHVGPGFGGSCFPKDTMALASIAREAGMEARIVQATIEVNLAQKRGMVERVKRVLGEIKGKKIAILGLAFKPNTDDIRNAPSVYLIGELMKMGARIKAYDPMAIENTRRVLQGVEFTPDPYLACQGAELAVIMTEWNELRELDMERIKGFLKRPILLDARNIYDPEEMRKLGFTYYSIGRG